MFVPKLMSMFMLLALAAAQDTLAPTLAPTSAPTGVNETSADDDDYVVQKDCNMTLYHQWAQEDFQGISKDLVIPKTNLRWWDVENFEKNGPFVLRNSHAVEVLGTKCRQYMQAIKMGLSGRHGPVSDQAIFDVMCTEYCIVNDQFREEAMQVSGCNCMDLSTKSDEVGYSEAGDWCRENSGRMMCDELERCGTWECALYDFSCPRMEYNTLDIMLRGSPGDCGQGVGRFGGLMFGSLIGLAMSLWLL
ncbi:hypothetical protein TrLO_g2812 [Triparma laevis f. longispina]|uniref:Uncharacterized protein n=1 Tax=Triparma laevis f. longispina TaxID=1714387 RepID=A0A9W7FRY9_9STRA|nr:hypothetical protein TrLO_g2812 [Triparma laevis f. longispina]